MKYIQKSRIETFLKSKGYQVDSSNSSAKEQKVNICWRKSDTEKINVPKKDIIGSHELLEIFLDDNLLDEFRKY